MRLFSCLVISLLLSGLVLAQTPGGAGIVYGRGHAFAIQAPDGWVLDNAAGKGQGLQAVFYREGSDWGSAKGVMYTNAAIKGKGQETLQELIDYDVAQFRARAPQLKVTAREDLATGSGKAVVWQFEGDEHGNFEAVAYIDEKEAIVMLVLTARTRELFDQEYPSFEKLVGSYRFLTADVRTEKK
jgi:hypothetical protein